MRKGSVTTAIEIRGKLVRLQGLVLTGVLRVPMITFTAVLRMRLRRQGPGRTSCSLPRHINPYYCI
jgi:hypothetical protein